MPTPRRAARRRRNYGRCRTTAVIASHACRLQDDTSRDDARRRSWHGTGGSDGGVEA